MINNITAADILTFIWSVEFNLKNESDSSGHKTIQLILKSQPFMLIVLNLESILGRPEQIR